MTHNAAPRGWILSDLKKISAQAMQYRLNRLMPRFLPLVNEFRKHQRHVDPLRLLDEADSEEGIRRVLFNLNKSARLISYSDGILSFKAPKLRKLPRLPKGYGFKGGAARLALRSILGETDRNLCARDLDLIRIAQGNSRLDRELARAYMAEDFAHGHGVEIVANLRHYLDSRDLSINEVALIGNRLCCSAQAFRDTLQWIIRPSARNQGQALAPMTIAKMLRFYAEGVCLGRQPLLLGLPDKLELPKYCIDLHYKRAVSDGKRCGEVFLELLNRMNVVTLGC